MSDVFREFEGWKPKPVRNISRNEGQAAGFRIGRLGGYRENTILEECICRLRDGESRESLLASGVDEMTISLAMVCK